MDRSSNNSTHKAAGPPSATNVPPVNVHRIIVPIGRRPLHVDVGINLGDREHAPALLPAPPRSRRGPRGARPARVIPRSGGSVRWCPRHSGAWPRTPPRCLHRAAAIRAAHREQQQGDQKDEGGADQPPPPPAGAGSRSRRQGVPRTGRVDRVRQGNDGSCSQTEGVARVVFSAAPATARDR